MNYIKIFIVTEEQYTKAIARLVEIVSWRTGASRVAAQVLLSAYNGYNWQVDISELGILDPDIFDAAVTVIIGRVRLGIEPHTVIENGQDVFEDMAERYQRLRVEHRWKQDCRRCNGRGIIYTDPDDDSSEETCPVCEGQGY